MVTTSEASEKTVVKVDSWERPGKLLDLLTKVLVPVSAACYVAGIIVYSVRLSTFGYYSFSLLQVQYVFAGVWALGLIAVFFLAFELIRSIGERELGRHQPIRFVVLLFLALGLLFSMTRSVFAEAGVHLGWAWVGPLFFAALLYSSWRIAVGKEEADVPDDYDLETLLHRVPMLNVFLIVGTLFFYLVIFGHAIYGEIPQSFGGGQPKEVRIVTSSNDRAYFQTTGFKFADATSPSDPVQLLLDTDKEVVFLINESMVRVNRDLIQAMIYAKSGAAR